MATKATYDLAMDPSAEGWWSELLPQLRRKSLSGPIPALLDGSHRPDGGQAVRRLVGMISTHYPHPYRPPGRGLRIMKQFGRLIGADDRLLGLPTS